MIITVSNRTFEIRVFNANTNNWYEDPAALGAMEYNEETQAYTADRVSVTEIYYTVKPEKVETLSVTPEQAAKHWTLNEVYWESVRCACEVKDFASSYFDEHRGEVV